MAERRPPGFSIPLGFYDGPEVESIPRRIRAAAVGVWALCGTFSANKLQDGYVGPQALRQLGCTDAIRAALKATLGPDGESDPLWIDARNGGIQFTKWVKYQRSRVEVKAYLAAEAERKRAFRQAMKSIDSGTTTAGRTGVSTHGSSTTVSTKISDTNDEDNRDEPPVTSDDEETSGWTSAGHSPDHRDPKTKTKTETKRNTLVTLVEGGPGGDPKLPVAAKAAPSTREARGTRLPTNWQPTDDTVREMHARFPALNLRTEHEKFTNHWRSQPGAKGRKSDWELTWRNWILRASEQYPARAPNGHALPPAARKVNVGLELAAKLGPTAPELEA